MSNELNEDISTLSEEKNLKIPEFRRDIFPRNIVLSAEDITDLFSIILKANEEAIEHEIRLSENDKIPKEDQIQNIKALMKVQYSIVALNGDNVNGINTLATNDFPDKLSNVYISNSDFAKQAVNKYPLNRVEIFLSFLVPNLKMDFSNLPSNPTENKSVINITGRNEDWVRATAEKIEEFFRKKKTLRPAIHTSGFYDLFLYLAFLPLILLMFEKFDGYIQSILSTKSLFFNVIAAIYILLINLIIARILFQLVRYLFPPVEYYKSSRTKNNIMRVLIVTVFLGLIVNLLYDLIKYYFNM